MSEELAAPPDAKMGCAPGARLDLSRCTGGIVWLEDKRLFEEEGLSPGGMEREAAPGA